MKDTFVGFLIAVGLAFLVGSFLFGIAATMESFSCEKRWSSSGMQTSWGPIQGCLINLGDGRWIPDTNYREMK